MHSATVQSGPLSLSLCLPLSPFFTISLAAKVPPPNVRQTLYSPSAMRHLFILHSRCTLFQQHQRTEAAAAAAEPVALSLANARQHWSGRCAGSVRNSPTVQSNSGPATTTIIYISYVCVCECVYQGLPRLHELCSNNLYQFTSLFRLCQPFGASVVGTNCGDISNRKGL